MGQGKSVGGGSCSGGHGVSSARYVPWLLSGFQFLNQLTNIHASGIHPFFTSSVTGSLFKPLWKKKEIVSSEIYSKVIR